MRRLGLVLLTSILLSTASSMTTVFAAASSIDCSSGVGTRQPVLLVHGYDSGPDTWSATSRAYLANGGKTTCVATFDYSSRSTRWVTDQKIGPDLADAIDVLAGESRKAGGPGQVVVVAHSMGGLAMRCALSPSCSGVHHDVTEEVAALVTLGTPNTGTFLKGSGGSIVSDVFGPLLSAGCSVTNVLLRVLPCDEIKALGTSAAAAAFTPGSAQLKALPALPPTVPVMALAGSVHLSSSFWGRPSRGWGDAGDLIVSESSAQEEARKIGDLGGAVIVDCGEIDLTAPNAKGALRCMHVDETNNDQFLAQALTVIGRVARANAPKAAPVTLNDLLSVPVPPLRGNPAGRLVNGALPNSPGLGSVMLQTTDRPAPVFGDVTGDGVVDAAAVINATSGAGGNDQYVAVYTDASHLLGGRVFDPTEISHGVHAYVKRLVVTGGLVGVEWEDQSPNFIRSYWSAHLRFSGQKLAVTDVTNGPLNAQDAKGIRDTIMNACARTDATATCVYQGAEVATTDARFAYGASSGGLYDGEAVLERDPTAPTGWTIVLSLSGGPERCSAYERTIPEPVLREFGIHGLSENDSSSSVAC